MSPPVDLVHSAETFPDRTKVVVIGGGIIGASAAYFLAQKGVPVALCEKGEIAAEQSSRHDKLRSFNGIVTRGQRCCDSR